MSYIPTVEKWIADLRRRMEHTPEGPQYEELKKHLKNYEDLLADLKSRHAPKPREPGEEG